MGGHCSHPFNNELELRCILMCPDGNEINHMLNAYVLVANNVTPQVSIYDPSSYNIVLCEKE